MLNLILDKGWLHITELNSTLSRRWGCSKLVRGDGGGGKDFFTLFLKMPLVVAFGFCVKKKQGNYLQNIPALISN